MSYLRLTSLVPISLVATVREHITYITIVKWKTHAYIPVAFIRLISVTKTMKYACVQKHRIIIQNIIMYLEYPLIKKQSFSDKILSMISFL